MHYYHDIVGSVFPEYINCHGKLMGIPVIDVMPSDHHQLMFGAVYLTEYDA